MATDRIFLGVITGAHGLRGLVRVKSFTEAASALVAYGPLADDAGRRYDLEISGQAGKGVVLARVDGVTDREAAERLKGTALHVPRDALPPVTEDEFYHADLIGLAVERQDGSAIGVVTALHDFGAGDLVDVRLHDSGKSVLLPFDKATVPIVDIAGRRLVIDPMDGLIDDNDGRRVDSQPVSGG